MHSGFRGGFIFPLFYIGATIGLAISLGFPQIQPTIAMVCLMAVVNVAITKTPISTTVILSVLSDSAIVPVIASFVSSLLTTKLALIKTQRPRTQVFSPQLTLSIEALVVQCATAHFQAVGTDAFICFQLLDKQCVDDSIVATLAQKR